MIDLINEFRKQIDEQILALPNVVGVGTGFKYFGNNMTDRIGITVFVKEKSSLEDLGGNAVPGSYKTPEGVDISTDVFHAGDAAFYSFNDRVRPAKPGLSIGIPGGMPAAGVQGGTFGTIVADNTDGSDVILSTNSAMANFNNAPIGTKIIQPAEAFGGTSPADDIGTLKRFVTLVPGFSSNNLVNAAVATITGDVTDSTSMCAKVKPNKDSAVGMLIAGSGSLTLITPHDNLSSELNISFNKTKDAYPGQKLEKCGAATEYSTLTVSSTNVTYTLFGLDGQPYRFINQVVAPGGTTDAAAGDSGAIFWHNR